MFTPKTTCAQASRAAKPTIRHIRIQRNDVFPQEVGSPFYYNWANTLHIMTGENVVRRNLLFKTGEKFDRDLLEESERKLRRLPFLGKATITRLTADGDSVDIQVLTQDQWSTLLSAVIKHGGGRSELGAAVEEFNFLGLGKQFFSEVQNEPEGTTLTFKYEDPQLLGSRWTASSMVVTGPIQNSLATNISRPFYSLDTKWAWGANFSSINFIQRQFLNGNEFSRHRLETESFNILLARAAGERFKKKRAQLSYRFANRDFSRINTRTTTDVPQDERIHSLTASLSIENLNYVEEQQIDRFVRTEDLTLGNVTTLKIGRTGLPIPQGVRRFELLFSRNQAHRFGAVQYLFLNAGFQTLFEKDNIASFRLRYYNKMLPFQTIALHAKLDYAWNLETSRQFLLGGDSGLRGYKARALAGDRRLLFNLENRIFTRWNVLTVALGAVAFVDAGYAWPESQGFSLGNLKYSAGVGLRLGYTKSPSSRVGRIDFAWPLNNEGGFGIFVGVDQIFSIDQ